MKLNLGCGDEKLDGYINVDIRDTPAVDRLVDLTKTPWPWDDNAVDEIVAKLVLPYLPMPDRIAFMEEAYRVLKPGSAMLIVVPGRGSNRAIFDPYYHPPEICEDWFYFFSKEGRAMFGGAHYPIKADFQWGYGWQVSEDWAARNAEAQAFAVKHHRDAMQFLHVTLKKIADQPDDAEAEPVLEPEVAEALASQGFVDPGSS